MIDRKIEIMDALHGANEKQLFELFVNELVSGKLYLKKTENVATSAEQKIYRISLQIFYNVNESMIDDGLESRNKKFQCLTDLLTKHDILEPDDDLEISE